MGPKKVKVGPFWFDIIYADLASINRSDSVGYTLFEKKEIYIDKNYHEDLQAETLMHELLHVIHIVAGIKREDDEEQVVRMASPLMYGILKENPSLVKFLTDEHKS